MMNSQLQKSSIKGQLHSSRMQQAAGRVRSESLQEDMSLIGFIPFHRPGDLLDNSNLTINMDCEFVLSPYRIRFKGIKETFPITQQISVAYGTRYLFARNISTYAITNLNQVHLSKYFESPTPNWADAVLRSWNYKKMPKANVIKNEEGKLEYIASEDEYEFRRNAGDHIWIENDFLCLCTYMNKITGLPSYAVFSPDDVIRTLSDKEDDKDELLF